MSHLPRRDGDTALCPPRTDLVRWQRGQLADEQLSALLIHIETCSACQKTLELLVADDPLSERLRHAPAPEERTEVEAVIHRMRERGLTPPPPLDTNATVDHAAPVAVPESPFAFLSPAQSAEEIGRLGPYRVRRLLGQGGMGLVFEAEDVQLQRAVALKVMRPEVGRNPEARARFLREARAAAAVEHDHVVPIFQVGEASTARDVVPYLAMPLLRGEPLDVRLKREGKLPLRDILRIGREIALGLAAAHEHGLIHRDIKPANVWLEARTERVKLLDFGLARAADGVEEQSPTAPNRRLSAPELTQHGAIIGTPAYMAPEQIEGQRLDQRCDLFSLGCVLYVLATGEEAFKGPDVTSIFEAVAEHTPASPSKLNPAVPAALSDLVLRLLAKKPEQRPASAQAVADALEKVRPPARSWLWSASCVVLLAAGLTALSLRQPIGHIVESKTTRRVPTYDELLLRPSPLDNLKHEDLSTTARAWAGLGDPERAPPELIAVLGEPGFRFPRRPAYLAHSPDGSLLAAPSGAEAMLFDARTGQLRRTLRGHQQLIYRLAFTADSKTVVTTGFDAVVRLWDVATGRNVLSVRTPMGTLGLAIDPVTGTLATGHNGSVNVWDATGKLVTELRGFPSWVRGLAFRPDGKFLACHDDNGGMRVYEVASWKLHRELTAAPPGLGLVAFSADGALLAGGNDKAVRLWDGQTFEPRWQRADVQGAGLLTFSPDGKTLLTARHDCNGNIAHVFRRLDAATGKTVTERTLPTRNWWIAYSLSPDGTTLAATQLDERIVRQYDAISGELRTPELGHTAMGHTAMTNALAFSPDGKLLASGADDRTVKVWDLTTRQVRHTLNGHTNQVRAVAFSPDGTLLASCSHDNTIRLWDAITGREGQVLTGHVKGVERLTFSPDGKRLASTGLDLTTRLWEIPSGREQAVLEKEAPAVADLSWSPDGATLAVSSPQRGVTLWDTATLRLIRAFDPQQATDRVAFLPDSRSVLAARGDATLNLWTVPEADRQRTLFGPGSRISGVAVRPDGAAFAATADGRVWLWQAGGRTLGHAVRLLPSGHLTYPVTFSPDGRYLASATQDGTICLLRVPRRVESPTFAGNVAPFRVALKGLPGPAFLDPATAVPQWRREGVFARVEGAGELSYPLLGAARYVLEMEVTIHKEGLPLEVRLGDADTGVGLLLGGPPGPTDAKSYLAALLVGKEIGTRTRLVPGGERLSLQLVNLDGRCRLSLANTPFGNWFAQVEPGDVTLRLLGGKDTAVSIHRLALRSIQDSDLRELIWPLPVDRLDVNPTAVQRRLEERRAGLATAPTEGKPFVVRTTGRPCVWLPPGEFDQGEARKRRVRLSRGFWMAECEVSQGEWEALMKSNPSRGRGSLHLPVDWVSWQEAVNFCLELTKQEKASGRLPDGYEYRLPTEAEWEYACRAGAATDFSVPANGFWSEDTSRGQAREVGTGVPNRWGLYDMHGNVGEWCLDAWHDDPGDGKVVVDPHHPGDAETATFVVRGGAWWTAVEACRSSARVRSRPVAGGYRGFRVVLGPLLSGKK